MNLSKIALVSGLVVSGIAVSSVFARANAAVWNFSYTGLGVNASGILTTDTAGTLVTEITGNRNGFSITSLLAIGAVEGNDNIFIPSGNPSFLKNGIGFRTSDGSTNIFGYNANIPAYIDDSTNNTSGVIRLTTATFPPVCTSVPEPLNILGATAGLALFGTVSTALRRRKVSK